MRRLFAEHSEIIDRFDDASAEQVMPDAIHGDSRHERIRLRVDPARANCNRPLPDSRSTMDWSMPSSRIEVSPAHFRTEVLVAAANEDVLIHGIAVGDGDRTHRVRNGFVHSLPILNELREQVPERILKTSRRGRADWRATPTK